ncbi:MAG: response regulator [Anaerolineae bacterium]|nr:response regulator [Anaerolineae bacterium]
MRWVIVEDEPDIYEVLNHMYDLLGAASIAFTTGEDIDAWLEAVDSGEITDDLPVFALIDLRLPGDMDGVQVGERIRRCAKLRDIPIVLMTAYRLSPATEAEYIKRTNAHRLLYKPLPSIQTLQEMFLTLVKK